ncbi:hypothetical protein CRG98_041438 [Punica granatum]|uniref:J domain-containing protein n=1 Tax=Punica granatum TaxID=22663 RepID=A0A2I0I2I2_PUNGR|nr:hypothetical protein CRG98_041438 [Punica granatum]
MPQPYLLSASPSLSFFLAPHTIHGSPSFHGSDHGSATRSQIASSSSSYSCLSDGSLQGVRVAEKRDKGGDQGSVHEAQDEVPPQQALLASKVIKDDATLHFKQLCEAYEILINPRLFLLWDRAQFVVMMGGKWMDRGMKEMGK